MSNFSCLRDYWGWKVAMSCDDPDLWQTLEERLPQATQAEGTPDLDLAIKDGQLFMDGEQRPGAPLEVLENELQMSVACNARLVTFVHAGVVAIEDMVVVIPGRSYTGKSTLTRALVDAGASYYSDEYAVLDAEGEVHPYPRALSLRTSEGQRRLSRETLAYKAPSKPGRLALVLVTNYQEKADFNPSVISPGQGVLKLFENTVSAKLKPQQDLANLTAAARKALFLEGPRGEAEVTAQALLARLKELQARR